MPFCLTISEQASEMRLNNFQCHIKTGKQQDRFVLILVKKIDVVFVSEDLKLRDKNHFWFFSSVIYSLNVGIQILAFFLSVVASSKQLTL